MGRRFGGAPVARSADGGRDALARAGLGPDSKTELITDRIWRTRTQLELAIVEWVGWLNHERLHGELGDIPPAEHEALYAAKAETSPSLR